MNILRLIPAILSLLLLAAHYYRAGLLPVAVVIVVSLFMLIFRRQWPLRIARVLLFAGTFEWIRVTFLLTSARQAAGAPWVRLAMILAAVTVICCSSLVFLYSRPVKRMYGIAGPASGEIDK